MKTITSIALSLLIHLGPLSGLAIAQEAQVPWSAMDNGSGRSFGGNSSIISSVGQPIAGESRFANTRIVSGFLGYPVFKGPISGVQPPAGGLPDVFRLFQNYPNPFNPSTSIRYELPKAGLVRLMIFNQLGQEIATLVDALQEPGSHTVEWNAVEVPSGVYWYKLHADGSTAHGKMILMK